MRFLKEARGRIHADEHLMLAQLRVKIAIDSSSLSILVFCSAIRLSCSAIRLSSSAIRHFNPTFSDFNPTFSDFSSVIRVSSSATVASSTNKRASYLSFLEVNASSNCASTDSEVEVWLLTGGNDDDIWEENIIKI
jgi:hypothetical protein